MSASAANIAYRNYGDPNYPIFLADLGPIPLGSKDVAYSMMISAVLRLDPEGTLPPGTLTSMGLEDWSDAITAACLLLPGGANRNAVLSAVQILPGSPVGAGWLFEGRGAETLMAASTAGLVAFRADYPIYSFPLEACRAYLVGPSTAVLIRKSQYPQRILAFG